MDVEVRVPDETELEGWWFTEMAPFGGHADPGLVERERTVQPLDRMVAVLDGGRAAGPARRVVATCGSYPFDMTVPGGASVPVGGVTAVAVLATHRRRGLLTEMMR